MIKSVNNYPISQLFDIEAGIVYAIPRYQREYSWGKTHWENLFDDLMENSPGYFLGSIICINQSTDTHQVQKLELVDGQQRLTTISLLFAAVYQALKAHDEVLDDEQRGELLNLKRKLVLKKGNDAIRLIPQFQNNNHADYRAVLSEAKVIADADAPSYAGNRQIFRAFRFFQARVTEMTTDHSDELGSLLDFVDKIGQASLVKIEVQSHADAYTLFESLNNRGMPLTAVDLIKNKLLARIDDQEPGAVDRYFDRWKRLLEHLGDDYAVQERFFRQYYNAFKSELSSIHHAPMATRSNLIQIHEKLINHNVTEYLNSISAAGKSYAVILSRLQEPDFGILSKPLIDLERIQGAPSYLPLLHLLERKEALQLTVENLRTVVTLLVRFFVRRNVTDTPPTRDLSRLFMEVVEGVKDLRGSAIPQAIEARLIKASSSDEVFRAKLEGPIYQENSWATRFILCSIAEQAMTVETWVDLWQYKNRQYLWTIEHIFPQGENIPASWTEMIANGDEARARELQQTHVHKLGNLTISAFNSSLGNKSFADKRDRVDSEGRPVGYRNGLQLNNDLATATQWSADAIDARTEKLINEVMRLFALQGTNA